MKVLFQHIPETGSAAVQAWLELMYPAHNSVELQIDRHWRVNEFDSSVGILTELTDLASRDDFLAYGVAPHAAFRELRKSGDVLATMLLDPVSRIAAWYAFLRSRPAAELVVQRQRFAVKLARNMSFERFVEVEHASVDDLVDCQAKHLTLGMDLRDHSALELLAECRGILSNYDVVGDARDPMKVLRALAFALRVVPPKTLPATKPDEAVGIDISARARDTITERNQVDTALHAHVARAFASSYEAMLLRLLDERALGVDAEAPTGLHRCGWARANVSEQRWTFEMPCQGSNWHNLEYTVDHHLPYRFMGPHEAEIVLAAPDLGPVGSDRRVTIQVHAVNAIHADSYGGLSFEINGHKVEWVDWVSSGHEKLARFTCNASLLTSRPSFRLVIRGKLAFYPSDLELPTPDRRQLGVAFHSINVAVG